jgi:restriction system protein
MALGSPDDQMNVAGAFELLVEALEGEVNAVNNAGGRAFDHGDYPLVTQHLTRAEALTTLRGRVLALRHDWEEMLPEEETAGEETGATTRRDLGRLPKGVRTPEPFFQHPILQALVALGGSARMADVLDRVAEMVQGQLKAVDFDPLPSDPQALRWRNTAQWARSILVDKGFMRNDSPRGRWEITEAGRQAANG